VTDLGLDGAKFVLVPKSAANPEAPFANEKAHFNNDAGGFTEGIPNNAFKRAGIPLVETSANGGVVTFKGIPYGSVVGSTYTASPTEYWLYEIEAPEGYRKPSGAPISITIDSNSYNEAIYVAQVANTKGFNMPFTGGAGTIVFAVAALALAGLAYRFDMLSKREKLRVQ